MKLDQHAVYVHDEKQEREAKRMLGLEGANWIEDVASGITRVWVGDRMVHGASEARLRFNYDLGHEVELLTYLNGPHWLMNDGCYIGGAAFESHLGIHLGDDEPFPQIDARLVQELITRHHTNPYLVENGRTYHYKIYDCRQKIGSYLKFIKRISKQENVT